MKKIKKFYTLTMASLYQEQGYYAKSKEAYLYLVSKNPNDNDLLDKIYEINSLIKKDNVKKRNLMPLLDKWLELSLKTKKIKELKKFKKYIKLKKT